MDIERIVLLAGVVLVVIIGRFNRKAGGILGLALKISLEEHAILKKMEDAFSKHASSGK